MSSSRQQIDNYPDCRDINQYFQDTHDSNGNFLPERCFKKSVYTEGKKYNFTDIQTYDSYGYYSWINNNFSQYSFQESYKDLTFEGLCLNKEYSLKPQQKFAARIMNTHTDNTGMLIYHGLGSGKTQTSIIIGEAFKSKATEKIEYISSHTKRRVTTEDIPGRAPTKILIVVPSALVNQYYTEIMGQLDKTDSEGMSSLSVSESVVKSATGEVTIYGVRQYYINKYVNNAIMVAKNKILVLENEKVMLNERIKHGEKGHAGVLLKLTNDIIRIEREIKEMVSAEKEKVEVVYTIISHVTFINRLFEKDEPKFMYLKEGKYLTKKEGDNITPYIGTENGLLIIDEITRLISAEGSHYRKLSVALQTWADKKFRIIAMTGTPIYDKPYELGLLINLLQPRISFPHYDDGFDKLFIDPDEKILIEERVPLLRTLLSGYVSYFKGGNPRAYPYTKITVMKHPMGLMQQDKYTRELIGELQNQVMDKKSSPFLNRVIQKVPPEMENASVFTKSSIMCNIAFPEVTDNEGTVDYQAKSLDTKLNAGLHLFKTQLASVISKNASLIRHNEAEYDELIYRKVDEYSTKFSKIARMVKECDGPVFVYSRFVVAGVDAFAAIFDALGFKQFPASGRAGSYFIWKGGVDQLDAEKARQEFNSMDNKDGKVLKLLLGTQSIMEGIDLKRVRQVHITEPWWNDSRVRQIMARAIRWCSHVGLSENERVVDVFIHHSRLSGEGNHARLLIIEKNDKGEDVEVEVYSRMENQSTKSTSEPYYYKGWLDNKDPLNVEIRDLTNPKDGVSPTFNKSQIVPGSVKYIRDLRLAHLRGSYNNLDTDTVDEYIYNVALRKLSRNRDFEKIVKEMSIDCDLNQNGNIIRLDERYEPYDLEHKLWRLVYENYSTGDRYQRLNVKSKYTNVPDAFTERDILENVARQSNSNEFKIIAKKSDISINRIVTLNSELIIPEMIDCGKNKEFKYSFNSNIVPPELVTLSLNKKLIPFLRNMQTDHIYDYFEKVDTGKLIPSDPNLIKELNIFYDQHSEKNTTPFINKLKTLGWDNEDTDWSVFSVDELKNVLRSLERLGPKDKKSQRFGNGGSGSVKKGIGKNKQSKQNKKNKKIKSQKRKISINNKKR